MGRNCLGELRFPGQHQFGERKDGVHCADGRVELERYRRVFLEIAGVIVGFAKRPDDREDGAACAEPVGDLGAQHAGGAAGG